jgi:hypothetical protein
VVADGVVLGGYALPKGVFVAPAIPALHYDEEYVRCSLCVVLDHSSNSSSYTTTTSSS